MRRGYSQPVHESKVEGQKSLIETAVDNYFT
jgi:hypothetical protein